MTLAEIKTVLEQRGLRPLKQLGQNFLFDQNICQWWVDHIAEILPDKPRLLEIGPGLGSLTKPLLQKGFPVKAVEKDRGLAQYLREVLESNKSFELVEGDALDWLETENPLPEFVVGNLPYNITSPLLMMFFKRRQLPRHMFLLVQKEFGDRLLAMPFDKNYGSMSVIFQSFYRIEKSKKVPPQVFYPKPEVDSLLISLHLRSDAKLAIQSVQDFEAMLRKGFSQRRKKIKNLLPLEDERRAEEVSVDEWIGIFESLQRV